MAGVLVVGRAMLMRRLGGVRDALTLGSDLGAAALLAQALRDPRVRVGYPTDSGGFVERSGAPLPPVQPRRRRTVLLDQEQTIAVGHLVGVILHHLVVIERKGPITDPVHPPVECHVGRNDHFSHLLSRSVWFVIPGPDHPSRR